MRDFKTLTVWQRSHQLALLVYHVTRKFPREELYGLTSQLRRAAVSIPANLAEGFAKQGNRERGRYVAIAIGSAAEVEYYFLLAHDLELLNADQFHDLHARIEEIQRMLRALLSKMQADEAHRQTS
jgi:four helix bundle protein